MPASESPRTRRSLGLVITWATLAYAMFACAAPDAGGSGTDAAGGSQAGATSSAADGSASDTTWITLFNGRDLTGWTPKIRGYPAGADPFQTFRVVDGLLTVSYDAYDGPFDDRFGHIFYDTPFSSYVLELDYRFVGEQVQGGADWGFENNGVMLHAQSPESMLPDQDFPISIEAQLLGGDGFEERPTLNVCTPGTHITIDGVFTETHCINSTSPTFRGDRWVHVELWVRGDESIVHVVEGDTVMAYNHPVIGGGVVSGFDPAVKRDGTPLRSGYIALQSESHPTQFRNIRLRELPASASR